MGERGKRKAHMKGLEAWVWTHSAIAIAEHSMDYVKARLDVAGAVFAFVLLIAWACSTGRREKDLPPGPPTSPIAGNALQIPKRYAHLTFTKWASQYGDVFSLKVWNGTMIVLSSATAVREVLDKKSGSTNSRPESYINNDLITQNNHILLVNGPRSALFRKLFNAVLTKEAVQRFIPMQHAEGVASLYNILQNPASFYGELRRYSASLTLIIAYGRRASTFNETDETGFSVKEFYEHKLRFARTLEVGSPPAFQVLPILKRLPEILAPWKADAKQLRKEMEHMYVGKLFRQAKARHLKGHKVDSWLAELLEQNANLSDEEIAWAAGAMIEGGSDTTSGTMITAILASVLYPECLKPAHEELDRVVGSKREPELSDMEDLPYCRAFIKEVMRWRPVAPNGVSHLATKDEVYKGMRIPKGATIIQNAWGILHDPELYDNPDKFEPMRFMKNQYGHKDDADSADFRDTLWFGAGRRICLGMYLAENSLQSTIPKLLWAFKFGRAINPANGMEHPVSPDAFLPGHLTAPIPFQCSIEPRSRAIEETIKQTYADTLPFLNTWAP